MDIKKHLNDHIELINSLDENIFTQLEQVSETIAETFMSGGKLYIIGSESSYHIARYFINILNTRCYMSRPPLPGASLYSEISLLSANEEYSDIYEKQIGAFINEGDILLGISGSAKSDEIIKALRSAAHSGIKTIAIAGIDKANMQGVADILLSIPSKDNILNNEIYIFLISCICGTIDKIMFSPKDS